MLDRNEEESKKNKRIQALHDKVSYEQKEETSPYVVDHFLQTMIRVARYSTSVTQALCDGGVMTLVSSIRDGWYSYPEASDIVTPNVRRLAQQNLCDELLKALSERLYIAAHVQRSQAPEEPLYSQTSMPLRQPRRRRPSWMATGG